MGGQWNFNSRFDGSQYTQVPLRLGWYLDGAANLSDNNLPDDVDAMTLTRRWLAGRDGVDTVPIRWHVESDRHAVMERAPFCLPDEDDPLAENFLKHFSWPVHHETGQSLQWMRLPVADQSWRVDEELGKAGFIQEATGWKPGPLQQVLHVELLRQASLL